MSDALERLTGQELRDLHDTLAALVQLKAKEPLSYFHPYPKQKDFFDLGATKRERLLQAGNQCVSYNTLIDHPDGTSTPAGVLFERGQPFWVWAWNGQKSVPAKVSHTICKTPEPMLRIMLRSGQWFEATGRHRVLSSAGWIFVHDIPEVAAFLRNSDIDRSIRLISPFKNYSPIERVDLTTSQNVYDFTVPIFQNYISAGVIHHNTGKSAGGAYESACHATGAYPPWWTGKRFDHPTQGWIAGESGQSVRDIAQTKLFGIPHDESSIGMIARELVISKSSSHGVADLFDTARIRHVSGGVSTITTKTYEQARGKWMGQTLDWIWLDEECPEGHYAEALARLTGPGIIWTTFTPLAGFTNVVGRFLRDDSEDARRDRGVVKMGLKDAEHFTAEEKQRRLAGYPSHERQARSEGDPTLGSGAIFDQLETTLSIGSGLRVPVHWAKLWGLDFGSSVFAAVLMAWDRDTDTMYVLDTVRLENSKPIEHVAAMRRKAPDVRVAWPSDGHSHERGSGETIISQYRRLGLLVMGSHACFPDGGVSVEAGLMEMAERMGDGRFRVMAHCADWFDEYRGYHRDTSGKIVKLRDHLLDATRYAVMSKRFARPGAIGGGLSEPRDFARRPTSPIAIGIDFDVFA